MFCCMSTSKIEPTHNLRHADSIGLYKKKIIPDDDTDISETTRQLIINTNLNIAKNKYREPEISKSKCRANSICVRSIAEILPFSNDNSNDPSREPSTYSY